MGLLRNDRWAPDPVGDKQADAVEGYYDWKDEEKGNDRRFDGENWGVVDGRYLKVSIVVGAGVSNLLRVHANDAARSRDVSRRFSWMCSVVLVCKLISKQQRQQEGNTDEDAMIAELRSPV